MTAPRSPSRRPSSRGQDDHREHEHRAHEDITPDEMKEIAAADKPSKTIPASQGEDNPEYKHQRNVEPNDMDEPNPEENADKAWEGINEREIESREEEGDGSGGGVMEKVEEKVEDGRGKRDDDGGESLKRGRPKDPNARKDSNRRNASRSAEQRAVFEQHDPSSVWSRINRDAQERKERKRSDPDRQRKRGGPKTTRNPYIPAHSRNPHYHQQQQARSQQTLEEARSASESPETDTDLEKQDSKSRLFNDPHHGWARRQLHSIRRHIGLHPNAPVYSEHEAAPHSLLLWSRIRIALREPFAEFWGTLIMVLFGNGVTAQVLLSAGSSSAPGAQGYGNYNNICWGWALGVMLGIYVAGDSGAYLNPAVTLGNCLFRKLPWRRFPLYFLAQCLAGFVGAFITYGNYIGAIDSFEGGPGIRNVPPVKTATAGIFATYPQTFLDTASGFFNEFIAAALLMFILFALKDGANNGTAKGDKWFPLNLFFVIYGLEAAFGYETSCALNFARDVPGRIASRILGYSGVWSAGGHWFWVPMVAPWLGCLVGGYLYDLFIYTGDSPVNTPWMGAKMIARPDLAIRAARENVKRERELDVV